MSRPEIIRELKKKHPKLNKLQLETIIDTFFKSIEEALNNIKDACSSGENLFPLVIKAVKVECSLGEIVNSMKDSFGSYRAPSGF